jgi:hypothetical protein
MAPAKTATKTRKKAAKRTPTAKAAKVVQPEIQITPQTPQQRQAKLNAYAELRAANVPIPAELQLEVEAIIAAAKKTEEEARKAQVAAATEEQKEIDALNKKGPQWVRNGLGAEYSVRLERQDKKKRIELKPRGMRGDLFKLQDGDLEDPSLLDSVERGIVEIVGDGDAQTILSKQTKNMGRQHTALAMLRNEKGEPYAPDAIKIEAEFNRQGVVVAQLDPNIQGDKAIAKDPMGGLVRPGDARIEQFVPTGGNPAIISSGFPQDPNTTAKIADDIARRKVADGLRPEQQLGLSVTVDPTQKG